MTPEQKAARRAIKGVTPDTDIAGVPLTEEQKATIRATEARWAKDDATTDIIAQAEAALDGVTLGPWTVVERQADDDPDETALDMLDGKGNWVMSHGDGYYASVPSRRDWPFIAWTRAGVPALIARIRELEGERYAEFAVTGGRQFGKSHAYRAGVAYGEAKAKASAEATVATLTAQNEAMRGALEKIATLAPVEKPPEPYDDYGWQVADTGERHAAMVRDHDMWLVADFARAALTTENQTNG
jgi:hypothetical protein